MDKKVSVSKTVDGGSIPSSPAEFSLKTANKWQDIPDEYITGKYVLNEHKTNIKKIVNQIPLMNAFATYLGEHYGLNTGVENLYGLNISKDIFKEAVRFLAPPEQSVDLFNKIQIFKANNRLCTDEGYIPAYEIVVTTEAIENESDRKVLTRLKKIEWRAEETRRESQKRLKSALKQKRTLK